jgi:trehalose 6-phosphate synthase/phosphatase
LNFQSVHDPIKSTADIFDETISVQTSDDLQYSNVAINIDAYASENRARMFNDVGRKSSGTIRASDGVVVISYFLPVVVKKDDKSIWTASWNHENLLSFRTSLRVTWIGSVQTNTLLTSEDEEIISGLLLEMNCYPIFINRDTHKKFYNGICKQQLWPVMHHHSEVYGPGGLKGLDRQMEKNLWFTYTTVNQMFAKKVVEVFRDGDLIWIHGFHLMILPSILRRRINKAQIGLFLHTPFPSSEIWKSLWCREDLLQGVLCADQIGFHLYEYARHFLTACRRVLGTEYKYDATGTLTVHVGGRNVIVTCLHVGVDISHIKDIIAAPEFDAEVNIWEDKFPGKTIIAGSVFLHVMSVYH